MDWNRIETFRAVVELGSFTRAALALNLTQSAVSRRITALEDQLGQALFLREINGVVLTEAGQCFRDTANQVAQRLDLGLARLNEIRDQPQGPLRLTTTQGFGSAWLTARISSFREQYPEIAVSLLLLDDAELDLRRREADCAIRFRMPSEPNLVQRYLRDFTYRIHGSPEYLARRGVPQGVADLDRHDLIVYGDGVGSPPIEAMDWLLSAGLPAGARRRAALHVNCVYGIYRAVESGMGLAALPFYMSERSGDLVPVLPDLRGPRIPIYFVYPEELRGCRRITALRDFLVSELCQPGRAGCRASAGGFPVEPAPVT